MSNPIPSVSELTLLKALWKQQPLSAREIHDAAADELAWLPEGSIIAEMLTDYAVMREQARACSPETS